MEEVTSAAGGESVADRIDKALDGKQPVTKELIGKQITRTFQIDKAHVVEVEKGAPDDDKGDTLWAFASVEVPDSSQDIVRIDGIDWADYHDPSRGVHLKILANHMRASETTGEPFVIGRVERFVKTTAIVDGKKVPALAFEMSWADTPLAKTYKHLFDTGYLDSFSVGMLVNDYEDLDGGGYDFTATTLMETSAVTLPANPYASRINGKKDAADDVLVKGLEARTERLEEIIAKQAEILAAVSIAKENPAGGCQACQGLEGAISALLTGEVQKLHDRLDLIEAQITVAKSAPDQQSPKTGDRKGEHEHQITESIRQLQQTLASYGR